MFPQIICVELVATWIIIKEINWNNLNLNIQWSFLQADTHTFDRQYVVCFCS